MGEDFRAAPVPIRLSCRYSNGTVVSCVARALSFDDTSLRVLSSEGFEPGVQLNILAPFLEGIVACRVASAARSRALPAYFELVLQLVKKPSPVAKPIPLTTNAEDSEHLSEERIQAARKFASELEEHTQMCFSEVLDRVPPAQHHLLLAIAAAAVGIILYEKGSLDLKHWIGVLSRKA